MSANKSQEPSPSRFIYTSSDSSSNVVLDRIAVAAHSYGISEDDNDGILVRSCEPQPVTGLVIFSRIQWRPGRRSLSPQGPRIVELPDSDSGEQDDEHTKLLRNHKAGSVSPLSLPHQLQLQQRIPIQTSDTNYPSQLKNYDISATTAVIEDINNADHHPQSLAPSPSFPPPCPSSDHSPSPSCCPASPTSSSTMSFCACSTSPIPEPGQSDLILEIQHICLSATQKFIRRYVLDQHKHRRRREREWGLQKETEKMIQRQKEWEMFTAKEWKKERSTASHKVKVKKTSPTKPVLHGHAISPACASPTLNARKAMVYSDTDNESGSDSDNRPYPKRKIHTPTRKLASRKPSSPFSYAWMASKMSSAPSLGNFQGYTKREEDKIFEPCAKGTARGRWYQAHHNNYNDIDDMDLDIDADDETDLDMIMTDPPSSSPSFSACSSATISGDEDLRCMLGRHGLPRGPMHSSARSEGPQKGGNSGESLEKNIDRVCSILWQRSLQHRHGQIDKEQKRGVLQDMSLVLNLGSVLTENPSNQEETPAEEPQLNKIADAGVLFCEILEDWDAVGKIEEREVVRWNADSLGGREGEQDSGLSV
ncbi:hypothetical protein QBC36DRAFT_285544 [Triangularia setosa]|uniref:Uncharacterized protein n=1 Tax=Triangularia setosa TaxID=2587417 RepID=A0AAN7AC02_9PEZI|nr:hypothetical protein QBC36DRAFT_285544 [Podospora setosa]